MYRLILAIPIYLTFIFLIFLPLVLLGWILIPLAVLFKAYKAIPMLGLLDGNGDPRVDYHFTWKFMHVWDNWEDGIAAGKQYKNMGSIPKQIIYWSCIRNPVNNLRIIPYLSCKIDPTKVNYIGGPHKSMEAFDKKPPVPEWFFAWQGIYSNIFWQFKLFGKLRRLWIGWKIFPSDILRTEFGYRKNGAGFAIQFKVVE